jgi:hypothetical protein
LSRRQAVNLAGSNRVVALNQHIMMKSSAYAELIWGSISTEGLKLLFSLSLPGEIRQGMKLRINTFNPCVQYYCCGWFSNVGAGAYQTTAPVRQSKH